MVCVVVISHVLLIVVASQIVAAEIILAEKIVDTTIVKTTFICDHSPMATAAGKTKAGRNGSGTVPALDPHSEAWIALCRAHAGVTYRLQEALTDAGLPPLAWYEVLDRVEQAPDEGLRMGDLAESLVISRGGLTKLVDRLVKAGL